MSDLRKLSIVEMASGLRKRTFSAVELVKAHLEAKDEYNAFVLKNTEDALRVAAEADKKIAGVMGESDILTGIPIAIKDLFCTKGIRTTACSRMLSDFVPDYESFVTESLHKRGAVQIGKTNMDEFAMGSANINSYYGPVVNPWSRDKKLVPGGSSGGSAAAVAGYLAAASLGSDTGGSVRQPASFCGIVGVKPTYGRCSRYGMISYASSMDQAGVFARSVEDAALVLDAIMGYDPKDATSSKLPKQDFSSFDQMSQSIKNKKIGVLDLDIFHSSIPKDVILAMDKTLSVLKEGGAEIINVTINHLKHALPVYYVLAPSEACANLSKYDGVRYGLREEGCSSLDEMYKKTRSLGFGNEVKKRILLGTYVLSSSCYNAFFKKATDVRLLIKQDFNNVFAMGVDGILLPTCATKAFAIEEKLDYITMIMNDVFTVPINLAGLPAVSIPSILTADEGLPMGVQIIGKKNMELEMMAIARFIERSIGSFQALPLSVF